MSIAGIGVTANGTVCVAVSRLASAGKYPGYVVEVLSLAPRGVWSLPTLAVGGRGAGYFTMNSAGQAVASAGYSISRSDAIGSWGPATSMSVSSLLSGQQFGLPTIDAAGKAYATTTQVDSTRNTTTVTLWTSAAGAASWTGAVKPALKGLYWASIAGTSANHAVAVGLDNTGHVQAIRTTNGGQTWSARTALGTVVSRLDAMSVHGSESGTAAVAFTLEGTNFYVATLNAKNAWNATQMKGGLLGEYYGTATVVGNSVAYLANVISGPPWVWQLQVATGVIH
jgi:hypothetical protein